jgi:hypothetical protein
VLTTLDVKTAEIIARLSQYASVEDLIEKDRQRYLLILKFIGKHGIKGTYTAGLRKNYGLSSRYIRAAEIWFKNNDWIKPVGKERHKKVCLTDKGQDAILILERYCYSPLTEPKLKIDFPLGDEQTIVASISGGQEVYPIEKVETLSRPDVREGIVKIVHSLMENNHKNITISIEIPPLHASLLTSFIKQIELIYWLVLQKSGYKGLLAYEPISENTENQEVYTSFWKKYLEKHLSLKDNEVYRSSILIFDGVPDGRRESFQQPLHDFFVKELGFEENTFSFFLDLLSEPPIRKWIEDRLAKDPDWFMPSFFWKNPGYDCRDFLGFDLPSTTLNKLQSLMKDLGEFEYLEIPGKGTIFGIENADQSVLDKAVAIVREKNGVCVQIEKLPVFRVEFVDRVKPPIWHEYSLQEITNEYYQLDFNLRCMTTAGNYMLESTIDQLLKMNLNSDLFYRNWRVLHEVFTKEHRDKIPQSRLKDLLALIQKAHVKYIQEGKPTVDLVAVLKNYKVVLDSSKLLQDIDKGIYDIKI